jgi:hypothetical protein
MRWHATLFVSTNTTITLSVVMESKKHKSRHRDKDDEHRHKSHKRKGRDSERDESRKGKRRKEERSNGLSVVDDDVNDDDLWVEKPVDNVASDLVSHSTWILLKILMD